MMTRYLTSLCLLLLLTACGEQGPSPQEAKESLMQAAEQGDLNKLNSLLAERPEPNVRDGCQWSPLMKAALNGHLKVVERLLLLGAEVNLKDKGGYTALLLAASNNHVEILTRLLDAGADINAQESTKGWSALIWAAKRGHLESVDLLIRRGANSQLRDQDGKNALDWAKEIDRQDIMVLLTK
jgi:ankyrin repeat protein